MVRISTDTVQIKLRGSEKGDEVFDPFRKRWVILTPEEWVRQKLLAFLVQHLLYPTSLIAVERKVDLGELKRRFDAVVFSRNGKPLILIECKAPGLALQSEAASQILAYQSILGASYLLLTNGTILRCWKVLGSGVVELDHIPSFASVAGT